jgi:hypothetical protein
MRRPRHAALSRRKSHPTMPKPRIIVIQVPGSGSGGGPGGGVWGGPGGGVSGGPGGGVWPPPPGGMITPPGGVMIPIGGGARMMPGGSAEASSVSGAAVLMSTGTRVGTGGANTSVRFLGTTARSRSASASLKCFVLVSSASVRAPGERWSSKSTRLLALFTAACARSAPPRLPSEKTIPAATAKESAVPATSERRRRRCIRSRYERERRIAREMLLGDEYRSTTALHRERRRGSMSRSGPPHFGAARLRPVAAASPSAR